MVLSTDYKLDRETLTEAQYRRYLKNLQQLRTTNRPHAVDRTSSTTARSSDTPILDSPLNATSYSTRAPTGLTTSSSPMATLARSTTPTPPLGAGPWRIRAYLMPKTPRPR